MSQAALRHLKTDLAGAQDVTELPMVIWVKAAEGHTALIKMKVEIITLWRLLSRVNSQKTRHLA